MLNIESLSLSALIAWTFISLISYKKYKLEGMDCYFRFKDITINFSCDRFYRFPLAWCSILSDKRPDWRFWDWPCYRTDSQLL